MLLMIDQPQGRFLASHAGPKSSVLLGSLALDVSPKPPSAREKAGIKVGIGFGSLPWSKHPADAADAAVELALEQVESLGDAWMS